MAMEMEMDVEMEMEMVMVMMIFEAPKASWELRFAYKRLLALDLKALEVFGPPTGE